MKQLVLVLVAALIIMSGLSTSAQEATPEPVGGCTVEPRTQEEANALAAIAAATPATESVPTTTRLPAGEPVDEAVIAELLDTLNQADACAAQRDTLRFLALYSDYFIVTYVFGNEPVGIDSGGQTAPPVNAEGTPVAQVNVIDDAVEVEEGIVAAHVFITGNSDFGSIVWFVEQDGRWIIQDIVSAGDPPSGRADIPLEAEGIYMEVLFDAANVLGAENADMSVLSFKPVDWPDASLGCPEEGGIYAAVVTPGYRIVVSDGESTLTYHTDREGGIVNCTVE